MTDWRTLDGLDYFKAVIAGTQPQAPMAEAVPFRPVEVAPDRIRFATQADSRHRNPFGTVHGGFVATVLDAAATCAVHVTATQGEVATTIDLHVKLMRPVPLHVPLWAEGRVLNRSKRLGVAEATLTDDSGRLYAHATATCMIVVLAQENL